ncbi:hypothetical protein PHLCEN_2v5735 [Hermanssonia centrifuga]|uniref:Uncharacterized protein n=1 Tax=Hermanssonia centrifuga TaxID=98765 RepID=A0A2R6P1K6_9APHY|nr:hypothetical protein PHLCEN_2v5735 [Hermanssonia centrifuga]
MRSALGYILTRSVGWAYPRLFCHSALYEPIYGFGPLLAGALLQNDIDGVRWSAKKRRTLVRLAVLGAFAFTDQLPWSYMCGAAVGGIYRLLQSFGLFRSKSGEASEDGAGLATSEGGYMLLPWPISSSHARRSDVPQSQSYPHISPGRIVLLTILTMLTTGFAGTIPSSNVFSAIYSSPHTTRFPSNLRLHVVMLTIPRLKDLGSDILISSVSSYIDPWQSLSSKHSRGEDTGLEFTVFAHLTVDGTHPGFNRARSHFQSLYPDTSPSPFPLNFYVQEPPVPRPANVEAARAFGVQHHLDFADAVQYAFDKGAEWTMFVEDDFVLCGSWGLEGLLSVMAELEQERQGSGKVNGAFIGTGGSGLIFHRSLLPVLKEMLLLIAHLTLSAAEPSSARIPSPPELYHPSIPPDVLSQACLTGSLSVCPSASSSSSPLTLLDALNPWYPTKESGWVISSRLLMGHRGGAVSTGNRIYESGKWECGWRHPMHGWRGADVVVV